LALYYRILIIALIIFTLISCSTGRISNLDRDDDEAIVTATYKVLYNGVDVTYLTNLYFNETTWGIYRYNSQDHFLATKLPIGVNYLAGIAFEDKKMEFDPGYVTFKIEDGDVANCLGYIEIRLYGTNQKSFSHGPMGQVTLGSSHAAGNASVSVSYDNKIEQEVRQKFRMRFGPGMMLKENIVRIDPFYVPQW
jgi:hypothetical protein